MRRLIWIAAAGLALLGAGIAVAHEGHANSIAPVSATFTATTASNVHTDTCTGTDGTYTTTRGRWNGAVSGDTTNNLNGNATIDAEIVTGPNGGTLEGRLRIDATSGGSHTVAGFDAVIDPKSGNFAGLAEGHGSASWSKLIANVSGNWTSAGGFTGGRLGGGTSGGNAVLLTKGGCQSPKREANEAHGSLTLGANSHLQRAVDPLGDRRHVPHGRRRRDQVHERFGHEHAGAGRLRPSRRPLVQVLRGLSAERGRKPPLFTKDAALRLQSPYRAGVR